MPDAHDFLRTLAIVLCTAAVTTVLFKRLRQPVVFGYLVAGVIVGPYVPIPIVADETTTRTLAEMGVILVLFSIGLELSLRKLIRVGPRAALIAVAETSVMIWLGYSIARAFGWTALESVYAGAIVAISSTTIIAKAFQEQRVSGRFTEIVFGILIFEDLIAIFLLTILTALSAGSVLTAGSIAVTGFRLAIFLFGLIGIGLLVIPRAMRGVVRMNSPETTLIAAIGVCFAAALLAQGFGYSVALGAFIAGALVAESGQEKMITHLVEPVRDMFAAVFFVAVGTLIDPAVIARYWVPIVVLTLLVISGKTIVVSVATFFTGHPVRTSLQTGLSLAQIGEFSFIIAGVGLTNGATREFLYPVAVSVSAITTLATPWLIRAAPTVATALDRRLPQPIQTFVALYGAWIERMREARTARGERPHVRRLIGLLALDVVAMAVVIIAVGMEMQRLTSLLSTFTGFSIDASRVAIVVLIVAVAIPLLLGFFRTVRRLGMQLAFEALPAAKKGVDFAAVPRRAMVLTIQLALVLASVIFIVGVTQPFLPLLLSRIALGAAVVAIVLGLGVIFWRTAADLHGHAQAGAEVIVAALGKQMAAERGDATAKPPLDLAAVEAMLPGLGEPVSLRVDAGSSFHERTLAEVNLRSLTGATVLAIVRGNEQVLMPSAHEMLHEGDVLAIVGSHEAVESARALMAAPIAETEQLRQGLPEEA
jgi:CPA2 family monovalent cation:H+ antiporter-2